MSDGHEIAAVKVVTLQAPLPVPVVFGNWVMRHREFAICGVTTAEGGRSLVLLHAGRTDP